MTCFEVSPHLNKLVKLNLKNKKRKVGWLMYNLEGQVPEAPYEEVICVDVHAGRKLMAGAVSPAAEMPVAGKFRIAEIDGIRSCL